MKDRYLVYFIIAGLLLGSFFGAFVGHVIAPETYNLVLIKDSSDYTKYGFKDLGVYYTNNELVSFDMPFIVSKGAFVLSDRDLSSSVVGSVKDKSVLTARSPSYSYKILAENDKYYVINYHMDIKASNKTFSVDLIPSIKGVPIPKFAWWNSSWLYYKVCNIANKIDYYQMKLVIGNSSGGNVSCGGHIKQGNYFQDVRFVVSNVTMLYHWMENCTAGSQATFWINNFNASSILMYYGNSACSNTSYRNGSLTFNFFDDFSYGTSKWTTIFGSVAIAGGKLTIDDDWLRNLNTFGVNYAIRGYGKMSTTTGLLQELGFSTKTAEGASKDIQNGQYSVSIMWHNGGIISYIANYGTAQTQVNGGVTFDTSYHKYDIIRNSTTNTRFLHDGIVYSNTPIATNIPSQSCYLEVMDYVQYATAGSSEWDWLLVRKYLEPSPYWSSFGGETTNSPPSLTLVFPVNNSVDVDFHPICSVWCNDTDSSLLTVTWQTNNTGAFITRQVNSSFTANSVCRYNYTWAVVSSTKYWFRVYVYDGVTNLTRWYCFTIKANYTLSANIDFVILFPVNNSRDICPCCIVFGVNVSNNVSENMTLTFSNNDTGDFEVLSNLQNGTYYFTYCGFNLFGETYDWWLTIDSVTNSATSDYQHFYITSNIDCGNVDISNIYTKPESDDLFLGAILNIEPNLLFLGIVLSLWIYFVSKYFDKKEVIFAEIQFGLSMPLTLSLAVFSFNYPLGFVLVMLIPIFAIWILVSGFFYNKRHNKQKSQKIYLRIEHK